VVFEVRVGGVSSHLRLGIPYALLKPISAKLSPQAWIAGSESVADERQETNVQYLRAHLQDVPVTLVAYLGEVDTTFEEIYKLKPGDLIPLDTAADREIKVFVEGTHCFWARPGVRGNRLAVEITRVLSGLQDVSVVDGEKAREAVRVRTKSNGRLK
ncbi:MAG: FliM/FliN family flagellar motor switch protein, partial [Anaerolineae bacterium]|nr:FliM/FliN family flagellar motor switch protein [Anaerolineae bacterium]